MRDRSGGPHACHAGGAFYSRAARSIWPRRFSDLHVSPLAASDRRSRLIAIGLMCGALCCFTALDTSAKWLGRGIDPLQTVWLRYAIAVALVSIFINPVTRPGILRTKKPLLQAVRSLLLFLSTAFNFFALKDLQLAQTTSIQFATPLLVALLAGPLLGEWVGPRRMIAIAVGFLGVLIVTRPGLNGLPVAAWWSFAGTICYAFYQIMTRTLAAYDSSQTTMFYSNMAGLVLITPLLPAIGWTAMSPQQWLVAGLMGLTAAFGHWLLILAHRRAPAPVLSPFIYMQIVWMTLSGYLVFGDEPDRYTVIGAGVVIMSGLYLLYRERARAGDAD
ncbi:MAG: multidrug transporter [Rhizobiales bacterium 65-9]|nr:MAG: multidrug transporter [Rhizobiales bacterium 65-9]